jgi:hypothetical protein
MVGSYTQPAFLTQDSLQAPRCAAQPADPFSEPEIPFPVNAFSEPPASENDGWTLHLGVSPGGFRICPRYVCHFAWGMVDGKILIYELLNAEIHRHWLLVDGGIAVTSEYYLGNAGFGRLSVGGQCGVAQCPSRVVLYWYPIEAVTLSIGLDLPSGWSWACDLRF